jgi:predicted TIM-barrel fold metal-dependent hydrolase
MNKLLATMIVEEGFALIDAHHHLWALGNDTHPWLQTDYRADTFMGDYSSLCRDYLLEDYLADIDDLPVVATVHIEAERRRDQAVEETRWINEVAERHSMPNVIIGYVDLLAPNIIAKLDSHMAASPRFRGVRCKPLIARSTAISVAGEPGSLQDRAWHSGLSALAERGLVWDLRIPWWHLAEAADLLREHPDLNVALNHAGLPWDRSTAGLKSWRSGMAELAACPGVTVKLSEFSMPGHFWDEIQVQKIVADVLELFGPARCMFASNFPVARLSVNYKRAVFAVAEAVAPLGPASIRAVFHDTAQRTYGIPLPAHGGILDPPRPAIIHTN